MIRFSACGKKRTGPSAASRRFAVRLSFTPRFSPRGAGSDVSGWLTPRPRLSRAGLAGLFQRLIDVAGGAAQAPADEGVELFLRTVGVELAEKSGLSAPVWGDLAPRALVDELRRRATALLTRAQQAGAVRADLTPDDITIAVWALRGVIQSERIDPAHRGRHRWELHLDTIMRGFRPPAAAAGSPRGS